VGAGEVRNMGDEVAAEPQRAGAQRTFLFVMWQGGGNVPVQLGVARQLVADGHRVRVLADPAVEEEAHAAGCEFSAFRLAPHHNLRSRTHDIFRDWERQTRLGQIERLFETVSFAPAESYAKDVLEELMREPADVVVVDSMLFGAQIGAEASGLPTAVLWHMPFTLGEGVPPPGLGLRPARTGLGRVRDRTLRTLTRRFTDARGLSVLNQAREAVGLVPLASVDRQVLHADRVLVLTSPSYDLPAARLPSVVRYVGPQLDDPTWAEPWTDPWPSDHPDPLVLVSFGSTFQGQSGVLRRTITALETLPVRALVTLGDVIAPEELPSAHNAVTVTSAPHAAVLPHASALVTHGGHGTVIKALAHGVPVVCIPQGRDQADNAARVEVAGVGVRLKRTAGAPAIRRSVEQVLASPVYAEAARRMARTIGDEVGARAARRELEALASPAAGPSISDARDGTVSTEG
jgi:MGT family glycosyltransferase